MMLKYPWLLLLFIIYIPLIWWYVAKYKGANPSLAISSTKAFSKLPYSWKAMMVHVCFALRLLAIGAIIIALCRPQTREGVSSSSVLGTDIVIALDVSSSMYTEDFYPNRFEVAKSTAVKFVNERENDNIGVVVFAGESMSMLPLTNDRRTVAATIQNINIGLLEDGTAIGNGLVSAINRVTSGKSKSKSIILLTDGTDNMSDIDPSVAANVAKEKGVRVYTIGIGRDGVINYTDPYGRSVTTIETKIDEESLSQIAEVSGGKFFRATDEKMLQKVFNEIDKLEKSRIDVTRYSFHEEKFMPWVILAMALLSLEMIIRYTVARRIP